MQLIHAHHLLLLRTRGGAFVYMFLGESRCPSAPATRLQMEPYDVQASRLHAAVPGGGTIAGAQLRRRHARHLGSYASALMTMLLLLLLLKLGTTIVVAVQDVSFDESGRVICSVTVIDRQETLSSGRGAARRAAGQISLAGGGRLHEGRVDRTSVFVHSFVQFHVIDIVSNVIAWWTATIS